MFRLLSDETPVWANRQNEDYACRSCEMYHGAVKSFWDPNVDKCVRKCSDDRPAADASKTRMTCEQANEAMPFWNPDTRECVKKCPELSEDNVCKTCAEDDPSKPHRNGESCQSCPETTEYWDPIKMSCVSSCMIPAADESSKLC